MWRSRLPIAPAPNLNEGRHESSCQRRSVTVSITLLMIFWGTLRKTADPQSWNESKLKRTVAAANVQLGTRRAGDVLVMFVRWWTKPSEPGQRCRRPSTFDPRIQHCLWYSIEIYWELKHFFDYNVWQAKLLIQSPDEDHNILGLELRPIPRQFNPFSDCSCYLK
jgi:hypothetical protein